MNTWFKKFILLPLSAGLIFSWSCNDPNTVGLEVLPSNDLLHVNFSDTATLVSITLREDSLTSSNLSTNLAGTYIDPVFGKSRAGFYAQVAPLKISPNFGVEPQADSVILSLAYAGSYGDTMAGALVQTFNIYQVTQDMYRDTVYYSTTNIAYSTLIGSYTFTPNSTDTVINLKLDTAFFRTYILNQSGQSTLSSVSSFQAYFKGIYVTPDTTQNIGNRILSFNLASALTRLHLYYHNAVDTGVYDLSIDTKSSCATVNHFYHDYVGTTVGSQLADSTLGNTTVYVQAMAGVKTKIKMPYLKNYLNIGRIAINKAELIMKIEPNTFSQYSPASQLAIQGIDSTGASIFTADYLETISYRGGEFNSTTGEYRTNITRYVQQALTGKVQDYGLYVVVYGGSVFANRSILYGSGFFLPDKIKLQITYSLLN